MEITIENGKKKILIVSHGLELGGVETSLIGLLEALDPARCDVDLFLLRHHGDLMSYIPDWINILPEIAEYTVYERRVIDVLREGHAFLAIGRVFGKFAAKAYDLLHGFSDSCTPIEYSHKYTYHLLPRINDKTEYDLAISFLAPHYICTHKVNAKKKIAWIHTDYAAIKIDRQSELKMWDAYEKIISISPSVTDSFMRIFPELAGRIIEIENILPGTMIEKRMTEFSAESEMNNNGLTLLSIGRYCYAKNLDNVPDICKRLCDAGINAYWYLIGYGPDEDLIKSRIQEAGIQDRVIMLGKRENPYPYIASCDLYIQPSRFEGKSVSVREAQYLGKPVVITDYPTSSSQVCDGIDGIIIPLDNDRCASKLIELLNDGEILKTVSANCKIRDYTNSREVEKLYELINV